MNLKSFILPDTTIPARSRFLIGLGWAAVALLFWQFSNLPFLPKPPEVLGAFETLRANGTFLEFGTSIWTMIEAIFWTVLISLSLAYLSVLALFEPVVKFVTGLRYLGLVGLMLAFTLIAPDGHSLKVMVLTFGMTVFYLRDMMVVVSTIPQAEYDHAKTLGMGPVRMVYEVVVLGTMSEAMESLRVNAAMGWMMLTMVEGVVRSEGGIGTVLINMNRHMDLAAEGAILITLFCVGIVQDVIIGLAKDYIIAPYARN